MSDRAESSPACLKFFAGLMHNVIGLLSWAERIHSAARDPSRCRHAPGTESRDKRLSSDAPLQVKGIRGRCLRVLSLSLSGWSMVKAGKRSISSGSTTYRARVHDRRRPAKGDHDAKESFLTPFCPCVSRVQPRSSARSMVPIVLEPPLVRRFLPADYLQPTERGWV